MDNFFLDAYKEENPEMDTPEVTEEVGADTEVELPVDEQSAGETTTEPSGTPSDEPNKIVVEGIGEFTLDELKEMKAGYMRQSDYTKKTQEIARMRKELEGVHPQPENTPNMQTLSPMEQRLVELEQRIADRELDEVLTSLKTKYKDFDEVKVLNEAYERGTTDLEFVYKATRETTDEVSMREQMKAELRAEIMREIETNKTATDTIIQTGATAVQSNPPQFTERERYIAEEMGMSVEEYLEYR